MVHLKNGEFANIIKLEKEGYKRLFVVCACVKNGVAFTECKTLDEAKKELPFFLHNYGNADIMLATY